MLNPVAASLFVTGLWLPSVGIKNVINEITAA